MDYFIFITDLTGTDSKEYLCNCLQQVTKTYESQKHTCLGKVISADKNFITAEVVNGDWILVEDLYQQTLKQDKTVTDTEPVSTTENSSSLDKAIFDVSESLPYAGVSVRVFLLNPQLNSDADDSVSNHGNLPLLGCLKKLASWHNAEIVITTQCDEVPESLLADFTGASVTTDISRYISEQSQLCVWRGKISVMNKLEGQGHLFPGFQLECEDSLEMTSFLNRTQGLLTNSPKTGGTAVPVFGRMLEVLDQVDSRTVPAFMLTSYTLQLSVWKTHPLSESLIDELLDQHQTAVVARLAVYTSDSVDDCSQKLSGQAWRESLMTNVDYIQEREEDLMNCGHFLYTLLLRDEDSRRMKAIVLRDTTEINSNLFRLESTVFSSNLDNQCGKSMQEYIESVGQMNGEMLNQINTSLTDMQTQVLSEWIDDMERVGQPAVMSADMLWKMLGNIQDQFLQTLVQDGVLNTGDNQETEDPLPILQSDLSLDPVLWPERQALQHQDTHKREMRRFQSSDSMCLSSPLHPDEALTTVDVKDFLKLFKPDGNAFKDTLSPIRQHSKRKLTKLSSKGETSLQWPDSKDTHFHGIDYYRHNISEKKEKHFSQLREKYVKEETCSSFTTKTILKKKSVSQTNHRRQRSGGHTILSPNRKSPRGLPGVVGNRGNKRDEEEVRPSISQPSRQKLLMQHPGLKSPRKRQSLPSKQLRRSPRKQPSATFQRLRSDGDITLPPPPKRKRRSDPEGLDDSLEERPTVSGSCSLTAEVTRKPSRSERHKKKLEEICQSVLIKHGVQADTIIFKSCAEKLFQVTKFFVKALPNSRNLSQEMKNIAEGQVTQVVDLEKRRQEMKKMSKK